MSTHSLRQAIAANIAEGQLWIDRRRPLCDDDGDCSSIAAKLDEAQRTVDRERAMLRGL